MLVLPEHVRGIGSEARHTHPARRKRETDGEVGEPDGVGFSEGIDPKLKSHFECGEHRSGSMSD